MTTKGKSAILDWMRERVAYQGDDCLIWPYSTNWNGYGHVKYGDSVTKAHRVMCIFAHGEPPSSGLVAAHSCNNGQGGCVKPEASFVEDPAGEHARSRCGRHADQKAMEMKKHHAYDA